MFFRVDAMPGFPAPLTAKGKNSMGRIRLFWHLRFSHQGARVLRRGKQVTCGHPWKEGAVEPFSSQSPDSLGCQSLRAACPRPWVYLQSELCTLLIVTLLPTPDIVPTASQYQCGLSQSTHDVTVPAPLLTGLATILWRRHSLCQSPPASKRQILDTACAPAEPHHVPHWDSGKYSAPLPHVAFFGFCLLPVCWLLRGGPGCLLSISSGLRYPPSTLRNLCRSQWYPSVADTSIPSQWQPHHCWVCWGGTAHFTLNRQQANLDMRLAT